MTVPRPTRSCLSIDEALRFVTSTGGPQEIESTLGHVDDCSGCRRLVAEAIRSPTRPAGAARAATVQPSETLSERYEILAAIGRGGMGEVYEARDRLLGETVALKTLACTALDDDAAIARIKREVLLARKVTHANVCRILEFGVHTRPNQREAESIPFFTMELLRGETLAVRLRALPGLPAEEARSIALQMLDGVAAVHAAGVVHRDLKPENVFLVPQASGAPRAIVMDLGLARATQPLSSLATLTTSPRVAGTLGYMSPEQRRGEAATVASDIYSLGVILDELLRPPRTPALDAAIARCLAPLPARRFRDVVELRRALARPRSVPRSIAVAGVVVLGVLLVLGAWPAQDRTRAEGAPQPVPSPVLQAPQARPLPPAVVVEPIAAPSPVAAPSPAPAAPVSPPAEPTRSRQAKRSVALRPPPAQAHPPAASQSPAAPPPATDQAPSLVDPDDVIDPYAGGR